MVALLNSIGYNFFRFAGEASGPEYSKTWDFVLPGSKFVTSKETLC